jgi:hypothetical protein
MTKATFKKITSNLIVFVCGGLFFVNLGSLTAAGDGYQPSWFNVVFSVMFAIWTLVLHQP